MGLYADRMNGKKGLLDQRGAWERHVSIPPFERDARWKRSSDLKATSDNAVVWSESVGGISCTVYIVDPEAGENIQITERRQGPSMTLTRSLD